MTYFLNATDFRHDTSVSPYFSFIMPVTRSASILASRETTQPLAVRSESRQEIIVLSDDEPSGTRHRGRNASIGRRRAKAKPKPTVVLGDVLEISSDDEPLPSSTAPLKQSRQSSALSQLQAQISMLQKVGRCSHCAHTRLHSSTGKLRG